MKIGIWPRAIKNLKKIPKIDQLAIAGKIRSLRDNREQIQEEKLQGYKNVHRIRVGKYRLIFLEVKGGIEIFLIGHRREVYGVTVPQDYKEC